MNYKPTPQASIFSLPDIASAPPSGAQPFVWGAGGARLSPEQLAARQSSLDARGQVDYSPVGHWTQGLARVAGQLLAGFEQKQLDKDVAQASSDRSAQVAQLLGGAPDQSAVASALASSDPAIAGVGKLAYERTNPKPINNDTVNDYNFIASKLGPDAANNYLKTLGDKFITANTPTGFYAGPQSGFATMLQGPGPQQGIPKVSDAASYNSLPSGSQFMDPEGNVRVKP